MSTRRIVAIVLPRLACEIVKSRTTVDGPFAVLIDAMPPRPKLENINAIIGAACTDAWLYGVRAGQKIAVARALVPELTVLHVTFAEVEGALGHVATAVASFGITAIRLRSGAGLARYAIEVRSPSGDGPYDTAWVDITFSAHLKGGEEALLNELGERVAALGHVVHLAIANGPRIAQGLARWRAAPNAHVIAEKGLGGVALAPLPVGALPLPAERIAFLLRVGVLTVGDLARLPRAEALSRLGWCGAEALAVAVGVDPAVLVSALPGETP